MYRDDKTITIIELSRGGRLVGGLQRRDVMELFQNMVRYPEMIATDTAAKLAACLRLRARLLEIVERNALKRKQNNRVRCFWTVAQGDRGQLHCGPEKDQQITGWTVSVCRIPGYLRACGGITAGAVYADQGW